MVSLNRQYKARQQIRKIIQSNHLSLNQSFSNSKMNMISLAQSKSHGESRVNPYGRTVPNVEVASGEIASDSCSFLLCEVARALGWPERRRGSTGKLAVIVVVLGMVHVGGRSVHGRCKGGD